MRTGTCPKCAADWRYYSLCPECGYDAVPVMKSMLDNGYSNVRLLSSGYVGGIQRLLYTTGLFVTARVDGWDRRWCYPKHTDACRALSEWDGYGDPPGEWVARRPQ